MRNNDPYQNITKHLCLSDMLGIIQSKITIVCYTCYVLCCLFLPILMLSRSSFPTFGRGPFPKIAGKALARCHDSKLQGTGKAEESQGFS